jgi:hypothetical protein
MFGTTATTTRATALALASAMLRATATRRFFAGCHDGLWHIIHHRTETFGQADGNQLDFGQPLNVFQVTPLIICNKAKGFAVCACARGAANAVDILFGHIGQFIVEHMADPRHGNPASRRCAGPGFYCHGSLRP